VKNLLLSYWRNDADRDIWTRMNHLLLKKDVEQFMWVVGDSSDDTAAILHEAADIDSRVLVLHADSGIKGEDIDTRRRRISHTETLAYGTIAHMPDIDYVIQHESDLRSPVDVVARLLALADERTVVAGWPILHLPSGPVFYDIWAYRGLDGDPFTGSAPYHVSYRADEPFEVGAVGSVWLGHRKLWAHRGIERECCLELCRQWRAEGVRILVDPRIEIEQPRELWVVS
jgi:hypothetical protein